MAFIAFGFTFATVTLSIGYSSQVTFNTLFFLGTALLLLPPFISAWLLLFPKNQKHAFVGLGIAVLYVGYILIDQIL